MDRPKRIGWHRLEVTRTVSSRREDHLTTERPWHPFDRLASSYDEWYASPLGRFVDKVEREALFDLLQPEPGELMVDVGSGTGRYVGRLSKRGIRAIGLEPSSPMLAVAKERWGGTASYVRAVAEQLPFCDGVFDAVLSVTTLEFVANVRAALSEAARVLKPGGRLVIGALNSEGPWAASRRKSDSPMWKSAHFFAEHELRALLEPFGDVTLMHAVYVPPGSGLPSCIFRLVEWIGAHTKPSTGAFIAARVDVRR